MKHILILIVLACALAACSPDPRKQAEAETIRAQAEQDSLDREAARQYQQAVNDLDVRTRAAEVETVEARQEQVRQSSATLIKWGMLSLTVSVSISIIALAVSFAIVSIGKSRAIATAAMIAETVKANLIPLDPITRQYPLLRHAHGPIYYLANPNTGQVTRLDERNAPDRQLISAVGAVQYIGVLAQEARQSDDPTGMGQLISPVTQARTDELLTGADLYHHLEEA